MSRSRKAPSWQPSKQTMNKTDLAGLYIHVPFCKTKCPYCDFFSITDTSRIDEWIAALREEAEFYREFGLFDSLYIGGGTPSVLDDRQIDSLIDGIRGIFRFAKETEVTVEMNPDDVTREKLRHYQSLGINRVSLGVQSFREEETGFLGRRHSAGQALFAAGAIRDAGFSELGIDLMFGLPGQSVGQWRESLEKALMFEPEHMSCYQLTVEGNSEFSRLLRTGELLLPGDELQAGLFLETSRYLSDTGYIHYEISNFAKGPEHIARHNVKYWQHTPYLGLGPSAHSFAGGKRWWNLSNVPDYLRFLQRGRPPVKDSEELSAPDFELERLLFGFRTMWGIKLSEISPESRDKVIKLHKDGFVDFVGDRIVPTLKGYLFADKLPLLI